MTDDNVVDFAERKLQNEPHTNGEIVCLACKHTWIGVAPVGTLGFECPSCGLHKGVHQYLIGPEDGLHWACGCGNVLFIITTRKNAMCSNCGQMQNLME